MAQRLILPLILLVVLVGLLAYVGGERVLQFELLTQKPDADKDAQFVTLQALIIFSTIATAGIIALWSLIVWLWRLPRRMKTGIGHKKTEQGLDAVEQALLAVEAGDGQTAQKKAKRAAELLSRSTLTTLISAQAAELSGDHKDAHAHYTSLAEKPETQVAGLHGLARILENQGDHEQTLENAKTAFDASKSPSWAFDPLFNAQVALNHWTGALDTLDTAEKRKFIAKDEAGRRRTVLLCAAAADLESKGEMQDALDTAKRSAILSPKFAPGAALAARLLAQDGQIKKSAQLLEKAWSRAPHPALALAYRDLWQDDTPDIVAKKMTNLIKANAKHRESAILKAEQALHVNDGVAALSALDKYMTDEDPSARICALAARAEHLLGNAVDARTWHIRATSAPIEPDWADLDPDGSAFNYTNADWQRLVFSYGSTGEMIHPRYEASKGRRSILDETSAPGAQIEPETSTASEGNEPDIMPPSPDDLGPDDHGDKSEGAPQSSSKKLGVRIKKLLDDSPTNN